MPTRTKTLRSAAGWFWVLLVAIDLLTMVLFAFPAAASSAARPLPYVQYGRVSWRFDDGSLPDEPQAMVQSKDGYLWIGTNSGLFRFDGERFDKYESSAPAAKYLEDVISLYAATDGRLIVGTLGRILMINGKEIVDVGGKTGRVNMITEDRDGTIWFARSRTIGDAGGLCRVVAQKVDCFGSSTICPYAGSIARDTSGTLWAGASDELCKLVDGVAIPTPISALKSQRGLSGVSTLIANQDGSLTVGFYHSGPGLGLQRYRDGIFAPEAIPGIDAEQLTVASLLRDSAGGLWIGTIESGVIHVHDGRADRTAVTGGLSGSGVISIVEDFEGDVWTVTTGGIDRFTRRPISSFGVEQGLPSDDVSSVLALHDGKVLAASREGISVIDSHGITLVDPAAGLPGKAVTSMLEDHLGTVWAGIDDHVVTWRDGRFTTMPTSDGQPLRAIIGMTEDRDGAVWFLSPAKPHYRLLRSKNGGPLTEIALPASYGGPHAIASDPSGKIWTVFCDGTVGRFEGDHLEPITSAKGLCRSPSFLFLSDSLMVFATGNGLATFNGVRWNTLSTAGGLPCDDVLGMVHDKGNKLWLHLRCGYFSITDEALSAWLQNQTRIPLSHLYDKSEGALTTAATFRPDAAVSNDGKMWFATDEQLEMIDQSLMTGNQMPPPVHIESFIVDGHDAGTASKVVLPVLSKDLEIRYAGLSFPDPRKVKFRYKLGGAGTGWTDVGSRRLAIFSRLPPGQYDFQVNASNNDGVWNKSGDHLIFVIPPAYYQTVWFRLVIFLLGLLILWTLVSMRISMAKKKMEMRMSERLVERDRIARELHDTLLQGVQSIALRFQVVADAMPDSEPSKQLALSSLTQADSVMVEIRDKVKDLREQESGFQSLEDSISLAFQELKQADIPTLRFTISGTVRSLRSGVHGETIAIAKEVLFNSIMHASATEIVCDIRFGSRFSLAIRDDGCGLPEEVIAQGGRAGHWGLIGIRERAKKMGALLKIGANIPRGTRIVVSLDSRLAYTDSKGLFLERLRSALRKVVRAGRPSRNFSGGWTRTRRADTK